MVKISDDALDTYLLREAMSGQHISGTCKMAPAWDPLAVVDQFGRVHGIDGLRVADASIMPDCIRANTNVTRPWSLASVSPTLSAKGYNWRADRYDVCRLMGVSVRCG
jgi:histidinol-phosphate/aromatic aminotransferase/cobyric acid decarboxylase-like protein